MIFGSSHCGCLKCICVFSGRFTEDGSFIGQYVPGAMKPLSGGLGPVSSAPLSPNASHTSVHSPTNTQRPTYV